MILSAMKNKIAIYGCGSFAREIAPIFKTLGVDTVFVSDVNEKIGKIINGIRVITYAELLSEMHRHRKIIISFSDPQVRKTLAQRCIEDQLEFTSCVAATHKKLDAIDVDISSVFCDYTLCTTNIKIGKFFQCNLYSYVGHDCVIGDFVTFAPRVSCNGNVIIQDDVYIGTGAVIRQGTPEQPLIIGKGSIIGMGAIVTKNVDPETIMFGNPAKIKGYNYYK